MPHRSAPRTPAAPRGGRPRSAPLRPLAATALLLLLGAPARAITLPPDFEVDDLAPGADLGIPTAVAFLPDGRLLVAQKSGVVWVVENGVKRPTPLWSGEDEVMDFDDKGLLGIAVDPDFTANRYVYLLYTVDPDSDGVDDASDAFGRLTRYQVSLAQPEQVDPSTRTILMGVDWRHGPLAASETHTIGSLRWGTDGSLLVSCGDGAQWSVTDPGGLDPGAFGPDRTDLAEDIGAFRAQDLGSLCGKVLRINPANGHGYASNPYADGDLTSPASKVWAYGLRNPFRFTVRPGTGSADTAAAAPGTIYLGDVGWETWEEADAVAQPGQNFGWPCYEGIGASPPYQNASPASHGCGTIGTAGNPAGESPPLMTWNHNDAALSTPPGFLGNASVGGVFYEGVRYPAGYLHRYFFADYGEDWIKVALVDENDQLVDLQDFGSGTEAPVDFALDPSTGDVVYVAIGSRRIYRIRYTGTTTGNQPPVARAAATPDLGAAPLAVQFSSAGTYDPESDPLAYQWLFGDGQGSSEADPQHTYAIAGVYQATLAVSDTAGNVGRDTVRVVAGDHFGFPTSGVLDDFDRQDGPIAGAWAGDTAGLEVDAMQLVQVSGYATTIWGGASFGPDQEVYVTFDVLAADAAEQSLLLKVQGLTWDSPQIEVRYDQNPGRVKVSTFTPGAGWELRGGPYPVEFQPGDRFGARAYGNGAVHAFRNGVLIGTAAAADWPYADAGGRLGMTLGLAMGSRFDDFGGGDAVLVSNTRPTATIVAPHDSSFYAAGDTVRMAGASSDAQDPPPALQRIWEVDLHHNIHEHPNVTTATGDSAFLLGADQEDGTGVWYAIRYIATDTGGLRDTARVAIFPEVDLEPGWVVADHPAQGTTEAVTYSFWIHNRARMAAPRSHWIFAADGVTVLAEGDTVVAALDSVEIVRSVPPVLAVGPHVLRVTADTLGAVVETDEPNNGRSGTIVVVDGPGTTDAPAAVRRLALSAPFPNPAAGRTRMVLDLPAPAQVGWAVHDVMGRELWRAPARPMGAGRWNLAWPAGGARGGPARPGVYLATVTVDGRPFTRRFVLLR